MIASLAKRTATLRGAMALAFGAGLVASSGQAPLHLWPLALCGLSAVFWLVTQAPKPREAALIAWAAGMGWFGGWLTWIVAPFFVEPETHGWMAPFALILMAGGLALFWGVAGYIAALTRAPLIALVALLTLSDALRGVIFTGFPWAYVGHLFLGSAVAQLASLGGALLITAIAATIAALPLWRLRLGGGVALGLLALAFAFGLTRPTAKEPPRDITLRLIQPAASQDLKWDADHARALFDRQLGLTATEPMADLTIWPETAVPYLLEYNPEVGTLIADAAGSNPVAIGIQRVDGNLIFNSLRVIGTGGTVTQTYDKHHLVPFGEYLPFGDFLFRKFGFTAFAAQAGSAYSAGAAPVVIDLGPQLGRVLPLICYEAIFPAIPRAAQATGGRADWMLQITNDAWFGTWSGPFQHFDLSRLRAIEQGLPLVRVGNTGVTALIGPRGEVIESLPFGQPAQLTLQSLPAPLSPPLYARLGDWPLLIYAIFTLVATFLPRFRGTA